VIIRDIAIFCDVALCSSYLRARFGGKYDLHPEDGDDISSKTSVHIRAR
jgi:hypothetical protein